MATKFTKGPWHVEDELIFDGNGLRIADTGDIDFIEDQGMTEAESAANAHLIAAAPSMYEALEKCLPFVEAAMNHTYKGSAEAYAEAVTALKLARGEQ